jgi:Zn-dependent protease
MGPGPLLLLIQAVMQGEVDKIITLISLIVIILLIAFPMHELAHAVVADRLGDGTPRSYGRISLNPFVHLNWIGSLMFLLAGFGFATTPVNPLNFRGDWRIKHAIVAVAGPIANLLLAVVFALLFRAGVRLPEFAIGSIDVTNALVNAFALAVNVNVLLFFFNLIPLPPLDGGTILKAFASEGVRGFLDQLGQFGWVLLVVLGQAGLIGLLISGPVRTVSRGLLGF